MSCPSPFLPRSALPCPLASSHGFPVPPRTPGSTPPELIGSPLASRGARLIPEMDQIFTEVEMTTLEKVINETWVTPVYMRNWAARPCLCLLAWQEAATSPLEALSD